MPDINNPVDAGTPVYVNTTPVPDMVYAGVRQAGIYVGGFLTADGLVTNGTWQTIMGIVIAVVPLVWGQLQTKKVSTILAKLAANPGVKAVLPKLNLGGSK